ncbi:unnamed protein product [Fraxinus pennsylvanica]|uniref:protein-serine/threonine phosphatase n=1 Tax=Fraxinus pennsylvanica TaxID=56036 RepID=A0AAD1ZJE6_9LAMI|nr:unnamed protein product [Fraxinus pennsylvanica]
MDGQDHFIKFKAVMSARLQKASFFRALLFIFAYIVLILFHLLFLRSSTPNSFMASMCYGLNVETKTTAPVEPISESARRRRMEIHQFKFVPNDAAVASPLENSKKRRKLEAVIPLSPPPSSSRIEADAVPECPKFGMTSVCGRRREMEDAVAIHPSFCCQNLSSPGGLHFFGLYDGHGCSHVATKCKDRMHTIVKDEIERGDASWTEMMARSFSKMDGEITEWVSGAAGFSAATCRCELQTPRRDAVGSTAVVAVVSPDKIIVSNCGDSRAVLCRNGVAIPLSTDHKPDRPDELDRIQEAGGRVFFWDGPRVLGFLAMSRAIGDNYLKPYVISEPEVTITDRTAEDECLILASDGLWDVVSNETACGVARMCLKSCKQLSDTVGGESSDKACSDASILLTKLALARQSADNISIVVVDLRRGR